MHDDAPTAEVAWFLRQAADAFPADPPAPGPELALLLAEGLPAPAQPATAPLPTRRSTMRSTLSSLPAKLALAAGLTLGGTGLAAAAGLPSPFQLASTHDTEVVGDPTDIVNDPTDIVNDPTDVVNDPTDVVNDPTDVVNDPTDVVNDPTDVVNDPTDVVNDPTDVVNEPTEEVDEPTEGALPAAPTSVSEAAKIHAFDGACGNHGRYVSYFARNGTEPPCALTVRNGGTTTPPPAETGDDGGDDTGDTDEPAAGAATKGGKPAGAGAQGKARAGR